jgi:hypothetical protein
MPPVTPSGERAVTSERVPERTLVRKAMYGGGAVPPALSTIFGVCLVGGGVGLLFVDGTDQDWLPPTMMGVGGGLVVLGATLGIVAAVDVEYRVAGSDASCGPGCVRW